MITPLPTKEVVIQAIRQAFAGVEREDGVSLREARVIDDYGGPEWRAQARSLDTEKRWEDVPDADIEKYSEALSFVDPKGFRYYIPAYMIWALGPGETSGSCSGESAYFSLARLDEPDDYCGPRLAILNEAQRRAIALFLLYGSLENGESLKGIICFWHKYLPGEFQI